MGPKKRKTSSAKLPSAFQFQPLLLPTSEASFSVVRASWLLFTSPRTRDDMRCSVGGVTRATRWSKRRAWRSPWKQRRRRRTTRQSSRQFVFFLLDLNLLSLLFLFLFFPLFCQAAPNNNLAHRAQGGVPASTADPEAAPSYSVYDDSSSKGKLHHHKGGAGAHPHSHPLSSAFGHLPPALDAHSLDKLRSQALAKARAVQSSLIAAVKSGGAGMGGVGAASTSHGGFGVVPLPPQQQQGGPGTQAAPATALSALAAKLGRVCDKVESSRATALACR